MKNAKHAMKNGRTASHEAAACARFAFFIACFSFFILPAETRAQDTWTLSTADFRSEPVALRAIDDKGVHVAPAGQAAGAAGEVRVVGPDAFLQVDRSLPPVEKPAKFMLYLVTGDRVGGEPVKVENDRLAWRNAAVGELTIPLSQVAALAKAGGTPNAGPPDLAATRQEDVVHLANGDAVRGVVTGISPQQVLVKSVTGGEAPASVPLDSVVSVQFATTGGGTAATGGTSPGEKNAPSYRVRLADGSSIVGTSLTLAGDKLTVAIAGGGGGGGGADARPLALASVAGIEQINGPVSWLTSRRPSEDVQVPFVGSADQPAWPTRTDADVAGQPFVVGGRTFHRGIGVHSYSRLAYPLDGTHKAFRTRYGMNDSLARADVTVRIKLGERVVHEAKNVRPGTASPVVVVDLPPDAKQLVLEVDYGEGIDVEDRLNWLEPALLRERPKAAPEPATNPAPATKPAAQ